MPEILVRARPVAYAVQPSEIDPGKGTLLFVHGSGGDSEDWRFQLDGLSHQAAALAVELPGHGASPPPAEDRVEAYAQWVRDFVDALGLRKVMLIGCSLGSAVTLTVALTEAPWLRAIGLVGAGARLRVLPALLEGLKTNPQDTLGMLSELSVSPNCPLDARETIRERMLSVSADVVHKDLSACNAFNVMDRIEKISVPAWIIVGEDDKLTPPKYAQYLGKQISDSSLTVVPDAGHLVMLEKPVAFNESLSRFLRDSGVLSK